MRGIDSWRKQVDRLRQLHSQQTAAGKWVEAQTTRKKLIQALDKIKELEESADELLPSADADAFQKAIQQATQEFLANPKSVVFGGGRPDRRRPVDPYDINCGVCEEWGERVAELYREATGKDEVEVIDPGNITGNPDDCLLGHVFLRFKNKFYDAECPGGVRSWKKLPLFTRQ